MLLIGIWIILQIITLKIQIKIMKVNLPVYLFLIVAIISQYPVLCYENCDTNSTTIGCLSCSSNFSYAFNETQQKFTCTLNQNCIYIKQSLCLKCASPAILDQFTNLCVTSIGCISYRNGTCLACQPTAYVLLSGQCYFKGIQFCQEYQLNNGTLGCKMCRYNSMAAALNCSYAANICAVFDYGTMKCGQCPNSQIVHSQGRSCYQPILNCLVYDQTNSQSTCLLCNPGYILLNITTCILGQPSFIRQQILQYNINTHIPTNSYKCLNNLKQLNTTSFVCNLEAPKHCAVLNGSVCTACIVGYYLAGSICRECSVDLENCALCGTGGICSVCQQGYYLLVASATSSKCMPCSSYGCSLCTTDQDKSNKVKCLSCPTNTTLYAGSCIACQNSSSAYSIYESKCLPCSSIQNCSFCKFTLAVNMPVVCIECVSMYYWNGSACLPITASVVVQMTTAKQILKKSAPGIQNTLYNDKNALMSSCNSTDGFICRCSTSGTTSLCSSFLVTPNISTMIFNTAALIAEFPDQLRMAAEFPSFDITTQLVLAYQPLTLYQFWNVLSACSYSIIRNQTAYNGSAIVTNTLTKIFKQAEAMLNVFSDQKITILRGNGFYFKHIPAGLASGSTGDDDYITTTLSNANYVIIYAYYSRLIGQSASLLSGTAFLYTNNPQTDYSVTFRKTRYSANSSSIYVYVNNVNSTTLTSTLTDGYFTVKNFPKSISTALQGVQVVASTSSTATDIYVSQRIQNIFYSESWLYILFFIALYLIFIPLCAIVDCCQAQSSMRKRVENQEPSDSKENQSEQTIVKVNYRDFFPLYNVGNTPRPRRLTKVCLFIVNTEHIVTFLTLIYFNLQGGLPVAAIALVVPAYLCTVIMGYIIGAIFRALPGNFKYLINILSLGYFFLWFFLMRIMTTAASKQYRLFIVVFSVLSFFLDLIIDGLQTLLVYFAIKQENQVALFHCLAKWLSLRGYYQFDKLAKQIGGEE